MSIAVMTMTEAAIVIAVAMACRRSIRPKADSAQNTTIKPAMMISCER